MQKNVTNIQEELNKCVNTDIINDIAYPCTPDAT